ncbi:hypothetical protein [Microcystis aeruginosa]|uniref:Transposase n=1 Tax=Microcystis aeruginosa Ma_QC_C_20070703_M131 TaxID=2486263 RepID=A0A551YC45_MICAE|nr:hypothetical protein [Microcystis aeruginosa]MDB9392905.1 hypothetical protein [Microcystis aeruginosa CS-579]TRT58536.1 MAG: hypothetical protein EWV85_05690 [Microcystis aeruginosa Ma_QC_C_20070703_M131]
MILRAWKRTPSLSEQLLGKRTTKSKEEKAQQIALKMLSDGFPTPEIARFTDLSPATIEELGRQQHN